jgi:6,7-dimethyl-8-ribityllumazine synthase
MHDQPFEKVDARTLRIGVAVSRYHHEITDSMRDAAIESFVRSGGQRKNLAILNSPGSFELTAICQAMATTLDEDEEPAFDAVVALGCIIAGETDHNQFLGHAVAQGLTNIAVETGVPIAFGVLTCDTLPQARARSIDAAALGGVNKGSEAMLAAIQTVNAIRSLNQAGISHE